ncbi:L-amino acid N-acyltransferase YncA [Palleronia aestuarii]|uniref:L-amino acid N-acyltransferase YncA n=1 Tax=Palleronia aestuarii TaxID=568105 RepID=A0A2W7NYA3_9RHOB|nr:GNAT family N-acetyltransferase [Palleronia aestuarii]PZX18256.1 L-amino acid N-acyltransferase YncA [Palleronia aestuarii]
MSLRFRTARREDIERIVTLLSEDTLGAGRESSDLTPYLAAFDAMASEAANEIIVAERDGRIVATYQITVISGLSRQAARRAQIEAVRVASDARGGGLGAALLADAEARARAAGCRLLQLTSDVSRGRARSFYERHGFTASHIGFKRALD